MTGRFPKEQPDDNLMVSNVLCVLDKGYTLYPLSCPSLFTMVASRRQPFPSIPPLPNPHGFALILRHYVQSIPHLFDRSNMAKQNLSHRANVICDGSPSRIRMVRRISLGMTTLPRSSIRLTIPVAFIDQNSFYRLLNDA